MAVLDTQEKILMRQKSAVKTPKVTFCTDCAIDWCKIRNAVTYCSQKYKGTSCYSCTDENCKIKRIAGS